MGGQTDACDILLLLRLAAGDPAAFRCIFDRYRDKVFSLSYKLLKRRDLAEDAVQDIFTKLWLKRSELGKVSDFTAYLNTVTRNYLLNQLVRMGHARKTMLNLDKMPMPHSSSPAVIGLNEFNFALSRAMSHLTPQQKKVYYLGKVQGMTYDQIAEHLEISRETVKTHMSEAFQFVKAYLLRYEYGSGVFALSIIIKTLFFKP